MTMSHCIFMFHIILWFTYSVTVWEFFRFFRLRLNFSHNFQWTTLATLPCLLLYFLWASFERSLNSCMTNCFACFTTHSTRRWINNFINVIFDAVCSYWLFINFPFGRFKSLDLALSNFPRWSTKTPQFFISNAIPVSSLNVYTIFTSESIWSCGLANNFKSSINSNWFSLVNLSPNW